MIDFFGKKRIAELENELAIAKREGQARGSVAKILNDYVDSLPHGERKDYMAKIVGVKHLLKPQLESMISDQRLFATRFDITEKERLFFISNINCLQLLLDWFERCSSENQSNIEEMRTRVEEDATLISSVEQYNLKP